jgi:hypothetical protein
MNRKILLILTNRWDRNQKPRFVEVDADNKGNVLKERPLRAQPREPVYAEVWENDEGKSVWAECNSFRRKYPHPLEKPKAKAPTAKAKQARR